MGKFLLAVIVFAALVYGVMWLLERRRVGLPLFKRPERPAAPPRRSSAPDDDEDFLRGLDRKRPHEDTDPTE